MTRFIDITRPLDRSTPLWPGREPAARQWDKRLTFGHHCNASSWNLSAHSGTHMDAPLHFVDGAASIDQILPELFFGPCTVADIRQQNGSLLDITLAKSLTGVKRLLIRSDHSDQGGSSQYQAHKQLIEPIAAELLLENGLLLLGTDRLSVDDSTGESYAIHRQLLGAGCAIIEGLHLSELLPGQYFLYAAPLRLTGSEASPLRAYLSEI